MLQEEGNLQLDGTETWIQSRLKTQRDYNDCSVKKTTVDVLK